MCSKLVKSTFGENALVNNIFTILKIYQQGLIFIL